MCEHKIKAIQILVGDDQIGSLVESKINMDYCICYINDCPEKETPGNYIRGQTTYIIPQNSVKIGFEIGVRLDVKQNVIETYQRLYHGSKEMKNLRDIIIKNIFYEKTFYLSNGEQLGCNPGHISKDFKRINFHTQKEEDFSPNNVFFTPEPELAYKYTNGGNAIIQILAGPMIDFNIGQDTTLPNSSSSDPNIMQQFINSKSYSGKFSNSETEWYNKTSNLSENMYISAVYIRL